MRRGRCNHRAIDGEHDDGPASRVRRRARPARRGDDTLRWNAPRIPATTENALYLLPALRRARDLIDRDYAEPLDLDALAGEAGYSRFHFARAFRAAYGETPRTYLTRRRIERAKTLLRTANLSVTEICVLVGFASLGSFSARFRSLVGQSPSAYRSDAVASAGAPPIPGCVVLMWTRPHADIEQSARSAGGPGSATVGGEPQPKEHR